MSRMVLMATGVFVVCTSSANAQIEFERAPINYHEIAAEDPVARLQAAIDAGEATLEFSDEHGYLPSVLQSLGIPESSQMLVFSKTSFQLRRISPTRPRAVYFNDDTYIGWVQNGDVVEVSSVDPHLGGIYYTLEQSPKKRPTFIRDKGQCLTCHASSRTQGVPGHLVRSVFVDPTGQPRYGSGTFTTDQESPFEKRWGGWYVSGTHGEMRHMGNVISDSRAEIDQEAGANRRDLSEIVDVKPYLQPTSDIVALMVLEHQSQMHNFITLAHFEARRALHQNDVMNAALDRDEDYVSDSTERRISSVGDKLLAYMLFTDEFTLTSPVQGSSPYAQEFMARGPRDHQGRSLRDLDLQTRLFKYPCSYLIYSKSFQAMPEQVRNYVVKGLHAVLTSPDGQDEFAHLSLDDRRSILAILEDTAPKLFEGMKLASAP